MKRHVISAIVAATANVFALDDREKCVGENRNARRTTSVDIVSETMLRTILAVIAGCFLWLCVWFGNETVLSALWPKFNAQQQAFQDVLDKGGPFQPETIFLLTHVISGAIAALLSGFISSLIAGENKRSPLIVGLLLTTLGVLKAVLSWSLVPVWYHLVFTGMLLPLAMFGGRLRRGTQVDLKKPSR